MFIVFFKLLRPCVCKDILLEMHSYRNVDQVRQSETAQQNVRPLLPALRVG